MRMRILERINDSREIEGGNKNSGGAAVFISHYTPSQKSAVSEEVEF
jgi:hypothetical protein